MTLDTALPVKPALAASLVLLTACDAGRVTLSVADAPVDEAEAVVVQFREVTFVADSGETESVRLSPPVQVDLMQMTGGDSFELISSRSIEAGRYRTIEFVVEGSPTSTESYVDVAGGARLPLFVPDDAESDLRVSAGFDVDEGEHVKVTVDFDLRRSVHPGDGTAYELHPVLRFVVDEDTGVVEGQIAQELIVSDCIPAVYAFSGSNVTPDDVDGVGTEPVSSALVSSDGGAFRYAIGFLEDGNYTLALTCDADADEPGDNDALTFVRARNATVSAKRTVTADFN